MPGGFTVLERDDPFQSALSNVLTGAQIGAQRQEAEAKNKAADVESSKLSLDIIKAKEEIKNKKVDAFVQVLPIVSKNPTAAAGLLNRIKMDPDLNEAIPGLSELDTMQYVNDLNDRQDLQDSLDFLKNTTPALIDQTSGNPEVQEGRAAATKKLVQSLQRRTQKGGESQLDQILNEVLGNGSNAQ